MKPRNLLLGSLTAVCAAVSAAEPPDLAKAFGALETVHDAALSPDGRKLVYVGAEGGAGDVAVTVDIETGKATAVMHTDGKPASITDCGWSAAERIVCRVRGFERRQSVLLELSRVVAINSDGSNHVPLGTKDSLYQIGIRQSDGEVVDWLSGDDGIVLMARNYLPEAGIGHRHLASTAEGLGIDRIDTRTGKATLVERAGKHVDSYMSDGLGNVRIMTTVTVAESGYATGQDAHYYRLANDRQWRPLGTYNADRAGGGRGKGIIPLAIDTRMNAAYVLDTLDGRRALYRVALDGSLGRELVFASNDVDIDGVVTLGRAGRVIGARYISERRHVQYFDPEYAKLHETLQRALPNQRLIEFRSASDDESVLLVRASSDVDPGSWYVYRRATKALAPLAGERPALAGVKLAPVQAITYPAADGTRIPAYLILPPGATQPQNLPALVIPHDGPDARDEWTFGWLAQYFAQRGFVVIQPNFRGSGGYGDAWFANNGYRGWKTSVGDVCDAGRWLVAQGTADPARLAVLGWGYGGYAALQANVLDPDLFKAVIAVAPLTDLALFKGRRMPYFNAMVQADFIGSGAHIKEGSPAQNPRFFKAPVLMFHGGSDVEVDVGQSRFMQKQLRQARKSSQLVEYTKLEHSLRDGEARADLLVRSDEFLRKNLSLQ